MARALRIPTVAALVLVAALGGYFLGKFHEQRLQSARTASIEIESTESPSVLAARKTREPEATDSAASEPQPAAPSLAAILAEARRRLDGGMINIGSIVDVFDSMGTLDAKQMTEVIRLIDEMPNFQQKNLLYMAALTRWSEQDGKSAADYVWDHFDAERRAGMLGAVFSSWAAKQPEVAWQWFDTHRGSVANPVHEHGLVRNLYQGLASQDFDAAMARLQVEEDYDLKTIALESLGAVSATTGDSDAYFEFAAGLENKEQRMRAVNAMLGHMAHSDPAKASSLVEKLEPGKERAEAAKRVAHAWFEAEPEVFTAWFLNQVPDEDMPAAIRDVAQRWLRRDPNAAGEFLSTIEPGKESDPARASFSQGIASIDPESALTWADTITDAKMREGSLMNIYKQWYRRDPQAAGSSLTASGLSEEMIEQVMKN